MNPKYQARWISKQQTNYLKKTGNLTNAMVLDSCKGHILIEPAGTNPEITRGATTPAAVIPATVAEPTVTRNKAVTTQPKTSGCIFHFSQKEAI